jgi:CheY-like chemotaxis protein/two-component sensor histidine kinase
MTKDGLDAMMSSDELERKIVERTEPVELRSRQLRALVHEVIRNAESERTRVAEVLHDDLQQLLASARLQLGAATRTAHPGDHLDAVDELLTEAITVAARLSHRLRPTLMRHASTRAILEWLAHDMAERSGFEVGLEIDTGRSDRLADPTIAVFLYGAVEELLKNVASHAGVTQARVCVSRTEDRLEIAVTDGGSGFDADAVERSTDFSRFGLLKLRERVGYLGGTFSIDSVPGRGTRVDISIPASFAAAATDSAVAPTSPDGDHAAGDTQVIRLLVVDDHQIMRQGLINLLNDQPDLEVIGEASDGLEAVEKTRSLKPDIVLMDVSMPRMGGIEATRRVKEEAPSVRVVGLTMHDDGGIARAMQEAGAEAFVSKTASPSELLTTIRAAGLLDG